MNWLWVVVPLSLFLLNVGIKNVIFFLFLVGILAGGICFLVYCQGRVMLTGFMTELHSTPCRGIPKIMRQATKANKHPKIDKRLTGSSCIDEPLQEIVEYLLRDFVRSWYQIMSPDTGDEFEYHLRRALQQIIINFANCCKTINWFPFLTKTVIDILATHIRLYRKAMEHLNRRYAKLKGAEREQKLVEIFFDLEASMFEPKKNDADKLSAEPVRFCRDFICLDSRMEQQFYGDLTDCLLYMLLERSDFNCVPLRRLARDVVVAKVLQPTIDTLSEPDFVNRNLAWLLERESLNNESFLTALQTSTSRAEVLCVQQDVEQQLARLRCKDTGEIDDRDIKQQISSLDYVKRVCQKRDQWLKESSSSASNDTTLNELLPRIAPGQKMVHLPFEDIFENNVAVEYFMQYAQSINANLLVLFYQDCKTFQEAIHKQQSSDSTELGPNADSADLDVANATITVDLPDFHSAAQYISDQYLNARCLMQFEKLAVVVSPDELNTIERKLKNREISVDLFSSIQAKVTARLRDVYRKQFRSDPMYLKLLAGLDLLPTGGDAGSASGTLAEADNLSTDPRSSHGDSISIHSTHSGDLNCAPSNNNAGISNSRSSSYECLSIDEDTSESMMLDPMLDERHYSMDTISDDRQSLSSLPSPPAAADASRHLLQAKICECIVQWSGDAAAAGAHKTADDKKDSKDRFAIYKILVTKISVNTDQILGFWEVLRRYSDFYDLHDLIKHKYKAVAHRLHLPEKKTFNNLKEDFLKKRKQQLDEYLQVLIQPELLNANAGLSELVDRFLAPAGWNQTKQRLMSKASVVPSWSPLEVAGLVNLNLLTKVGGLVNPVKSGVRSVKNALVSVPDSVIDGVSKVGGELMDNVGKLLHFNDDKPTKEQNSQRQLSQAGVANEENIPLRILLMLFDQIFELGKKDQWLRRQIISILRHLLVVTHGDTVHRKIYETVDRLTGIEQMSVYVRMLRDTFWPLGQLQQEWRVRSRETQLRTQLVCRTKLLGSIPDELRPVVGAETCRRGVERVFQMLQNATLNKRLVLVVLESFAVQLYPQMETLFERTLSRQPARMHMRPPEPVGVAPPEPDRGASLPRSRSFDFGPRAASRSPGAPAERRRPRPHSHAPVDSSPRRQLSTPARDTALKRISASPSLDFDFAQSVV